MKKHRAANNRVTYAYIALLNICVFVMFLSILTPMPAIPQPVIAAVHVSSQKKANAPSPIIGTPSRISVPSAGIDTVVRSGSYDVDAQTWSIDHQSAFHADITVPVNNTNGTTLIYGHAGWGIFGTLPKVREGAIAYVYTAEGYRFEYTFESNRQVEPSDVSILTTLGTPKLVLQTCSGAFDAYRTLVTFNFKEVVRDE